MDINKFALFADVAFTKNFTKSGERMGYTQPGVSHVLKTMEDEFGFPLFLRTRKGVTMTPNAEAILPIIREIVSLNEKLEQTINNINGLETGHLTIAAFASISRRWIPSFIYAFKQKYPGIEIELLEGGTDEIVAWVESSQADLGFLSKRHTKQLKWHSLANDPLMAILPKDYDVHGRSSIPMKEFEEQPFIISAEGVDYDVHEAIRVANITPNIRYSSTDDHTVISMVSSNLGISILPNLVIGTARDEIRALPLDPYVSRELGIITNSEYKPSPAARRFIECVEETLPKIINKDPELQSS
ncbi:MAG: LysR substrate-binding domain-containing protein [Lachnospiraceae bacterium]|nr:LysR substrate-binding domain-containing protein [Lachnospiraceae bacterium]MDY6360070.1 LysR substrate-binding domain-containing protein [Lachnospiraceae bacterium]HCJ76192.1 LysR family transcriptional regulator [Roseburia sp.]